LLNIQYKGESLKKFAASMEEERKRVQFMLSTLTPFQQQQVNQQVTAYQHQLGKQKYSPEKTSAAVFEFWKTMVIYIYNNTAGRSVVPATPPPVQKPPATAVVLSSTFKNVPPAPSKPHPLSMFNGSFSMPASTTKKPPAQTNPVSSKHSTNPLQLFTAPVRLVDKSGGLLPALMSGMSSGMPTGLQDWVNRLYLRMLQVPGSKMSTDDYVTRLIDSMKVSGEIYVKNWVSFPLPHPTEIVSPLPGSSGPPPNRGTDFIPINVAPVKKGVKLEPTKKKQKLMQIENNKRANRFERFAEHLNNPTTSAAVAAAAPVDVRIDFSYDEDDVFELTGKYAVVGTCDRMEKRYLRLTSAPDPALVRPEPILSRWLNELEGIWSRREREWKYVEDQMRAIRQDLTVQNIRGPFTVRVYTLNARWALESGDLGQFNQCQTQIKMLHESCQVGGSDSKAEFQCYRLLYYFYQNLKMDEQVFIKQILGDLPVHPFVRFALEVRQAAINGNHSRYFSLTQREGEGIPSHAKFLFRAFELRQRVSALIVLMKAMVVQLSVEWVSSVLAFKSVEECRGFLDANGFIMKSKNQIDSKASLPVLLSHSVLHSQKLNLMG
jgi:hypothetical protein